jgi:hypothetical protein
MCAPVQSVGQPPVEVDPWGHVAGLAERFDHDLRREVWPIRPDVVAPVGVRKTGEVDERTGHVSVARRVSHMDIESHRDEQHHAGRRDAGRRDAGWRIVDDVGHDRASRPARSSPWFDAQDVAMIPPDRSTF